MNEKYVIIISGASSGMGRDMARLLAKRYKVDAEFWLIARRIDRLRELSAELSSMGKSSVLIEGDLCEDSIFGAISDKLSKEGARVLMLVNAAGFGKIGSVAETPAFELSSMVRLNCEALTRLTREVLPYMAEGYAHIINFASSAAFLPQPYFTVYAASKSYVLSFSEALREELREKNIGVTAVCPGPVKTEFFDIAEEHTALPLYKRLFMARSDRVTKKAFRDALLGRSVSIYGISMKGFYLLTKILPKRVIFSVMRKINEI